MVRKLLVRTAIAAALTWSGAAQAAVTLYGLTSAQSGRNLVSFNSETPGTFATNVNITGDVNRQIDLFSLDLNTSNNTLYAIGSVGGGDYALFSIAFNGVATRIGMTLGSGINITAENAAFDYDAALNSFRLIGNGDQLYFVNPATGVASAGQTIDYAPGDPLFRNNPNVVGSAYNGKFYVLDKNGPGNNGQLATLTGTTLNSVAALTLQLNGNASFDIASNGEAYFDTGVVDDHLYALNLATGATTDKGALQLRLTGLTAAPGQTTPGVPEPATWAMMILGFGAIGGALRRRRGLRPALG